MGGHWSGKEAFNVGFEEDWTGKLSLKDIEAKEGEVYRYYLCTLHTGGDAMCRTPRGHVSRRVCGSAG